MPENILIVAPEIRGVRKGGGLADAIKSYAGALMRHYKTSPTVVIPTPEDSQIDLTNPLTTIKCGNYEGPVYQLTLDRINVLTVGSPKDMPPYKPSIRVYPLHPGKGNVETYGAYRINKEDARSSALFTRYVAEVIKQGIVKPDIVDAHDWGSAALVILLQRNADENLRRLPVAYESHNELYKGTLFPDAPDWDRLRIDSWNYFVDAFGLEGLVSYFDSPNFITPQPSIKKTGSSDPTFSIGQGVMNLADAARVVGEHYAKEAQTYEKDIPGIQNGLDPNAKFDLLNVPPGSDMGTMLQAKKEAKIALQKELGLSIDPNVKLLVWLHRYAEEKNIPALEYVIANLGDTKIQIVARRVPEYAKHDSKKYNTKNVFEDDKFTSRAFRAADGFLGLSIIEPWGCSVAQGIAALAVPIVSPAAGHMDLVTQYDGEDGIGFMAKTFSRDDLMNAVIEFVKAAENPQHLQRLRKNLNKKDLTWERGPLLKHLGLYEQAKNARDRRIAK